MKTDTIIVGSGIAGLMMTAVLQSHSKVVTMISDDNFPCASMVAAGMYNAIVLKRFVAIDQADEILSAMNGACDWIETHYQTKIRYPFRLMRIFSNALEKQTWQKKQTSPELHAYLSDQFIPESTLPYAPFGMGELLQCGRIDILKLKACLKESLIGQNAWINESFDYDALIINNKGVRYKNIEANHVVFAQGMGSKNNPWFGYLPLIPNKGEVIQIETPTHHWNGIYKAHAFAMPLSDTSAYLGSTYDRDFTTIEPSEKAKSFLLDQFHGMFGVSYKLLAHKSGLRATTQDLKPIIGIHHQYPQLALINGMGTRGTLLAPYASNYLYEYLYRNRAIPQEMNIRRFD